MLIEPSMSINAISALPVKQVNIAAVSDTNNLSNVITASKVQAAKNQPLSQIIKGKLKPGGGQL